MYCKSNLVLNIASNMIQLELQAPNVNIQTDKEKNGLHKT